MEASLLPLTNLSDFTNTAQSCLSEALRAISGQTDAMSKKALLVESLGNVEYRFSVSNYLLHDLPVNQCVLKCSVGVVELLLPCEGILYLTKRWISKVHTVVVREQQGEMLYIS